MEYVNLTFMVFWRFKEYPYLKVTKCKKVINSQRGTMLKYHPRGFFIGGKYIKRSELNKYLEVIPKQDTPF